MSDLIHDKKFSLCSLGGFETEPQGYVLINVRIPGVRGYDEDQIALVIEDSVAQTAGTPVVLGTPTIY